MPMIDIYAGAGTFANARNPATDAGALDRGRPGRMGAVGACTDER
jgi:hypothetical protein